ncbi:MAG: molybdopterin-dependent oxidoreductase, partial [Dehalococcoidia bacterium]|nr:molybdopterin-dependent oxidoreductase [Dehalococcoidia bacterium]
SSGQLTVWVSSQNLYLCRLSLSVTLGIPESKIRIIKPTVGGGFGGKVEMYAHDFAASLLSMKTGRPVKIICSRDEVFSCTRYRNPMSIWLRTGTRKDGTLLARDCRIIADGGAATSTGLGALYLAGMLPNVAYRLPAFRYRGIRAYTNKPPTGPQRGHGALQGVFAMESQMDMLAEDLGLDPVEIRRRNAMTTGYVMANNVRIFSSGLPECIDHASDDFHWEDTSRDSGQGRGIAAGAFTSGQQIVPHLHASAFIKIHHDGAITLFTGAPDIGQGSNTVLAQIAAEELGVTMEDIRVVAADSELTPMDSGAYSSRVTVFVGNAVKEAASKAKDRLLEAAAGQLEARPGDLEARGGRIWVRGSPDRGMTYQQASKAYFRQKEEPIIAHGTYHQQEQTGVAHGVFQTPRGVLPSESGIETPSPAFSFAAQVAEVQVDRETGQVSVVRYAASHDSGRALNPLAVEGQIQGSILGGLGQALMEELDRKDGQALNPSFLDYRLPTVFEAPVCRVWETDAPDPVGPFGAKESGEGTQVPGPAAIANAIYDAVGVRITTLPITPERVLEALNRRGLESRNRKLG